MIRGACHLDALWERMKTDLSVKKHIHSDESTLHVLNEPELAAQTRSLMRLYRTGREGPSIALFEYQQSRSADRPKQFREDSSGYLQVDGYVEYSG